MAVINFDYSYLSKNVCSGVADAATYLNKAYQILVGGLDIPADFSHRGTLYNLSGTVSSHINSLEKFNEWIDDTNKTFEKIETTHEKEISLIEDYSVKKRNRLV